MIVDKLPLPEDPTPNEAPPSYDDVEPSPSRAGYSSDEKANQRNPYLSPISPTGSATSPTQTTSLLSAKGKSPAKASSSWFGFGQASRAAKEVKTTVLGLIRDVVQNADADVSSCISILESCSDACRAQNVPFNTVLQEKSIEGHSPIYWAIVKRPPVEQAQVGPDVLSSLLSMAAPLTDATISEIRLACLDTSDQALFQHLRRSPAFAPLSGTDQILLGATVPPDDIEVQDIAGDEGAFAVRFRIVAFQKRMRVTKHIHLEFIARSRIWRLSFMIVENPSGMMLGTKHYTTGKWLVALTLLEHSPPTWIDSRVLIEDPLSGALRSDSPANPIHSSSRSAKPKPTIELRVRSQVMQLQSHGHHSLIGASLDDSLMGNSLQYEGSSYIHPDGSLSGRLEAKLIKNDSPECVIC
ncbi:hypothetical protein EIP91_008151 [Steccherinum ochraceum]|uniref:Uncharacterized protein n=1 Tax=Steccherinum ochraceum TaxID=92696 RepID=A0A4V2MV98_9APHY|nr:hypothetical protein EIP91_008151 [Steccherinum ochraceum]